MSKMDNYFDELEEWFKDKPVNTIKQCILCSTVAKDKDVLYKSGISKCPSCGFVFRTNQPTSEVLGEFYSKSKPMAIWSSIKAYGIREMNRQFSKFKVLIDYIFNKKIKSVFDYGCGNGTFLSLLPKDINRVGLEVNVDAIKLVSESQIDKVVVSLDQVSTKFDLVTLCGVLEHLENPSQIIKKLRPYVKTNKYLGIIVPNINSLLITLGKDKVSTFCPQHLWYFSIKTLTKLMKDNGFKLDFYTTIESEEVPIANILAGNHLYHKSDSIIINKKMDEFILKNNLGYKIVAIFKKGKKV